MAFNIESLDYIGEEYIHRRTENLKFIGSIRHDKFYPPNEAKEDIIESDESNYLYGGVPFRQENEFRATDLIFQVSPKLPMDTSQIFNNVGFVISDKVRENYYVVDVTDRIDLIPIIEWIKQGVDNRYAIGRFKKPIWQFEYDLICYDISKLIGDEIDKERAWDNNLFYNSELIWKLLKKYKRIEISGLKINRAENKKYVSVQSIYESTFLEKVEKK